MCHRRSRTQEILPRSRYESLDNRAAWSLVAERLFGCGSHGQVVLTKLSMIILRKLQGLIDKDRTTFPSTTDMGIERGRCFSRNKSTGDVTDFSWNHWQVLSRAVYHDL